MSNPWYLQPAQTLSTSAEQQARERQDQLTKPPGSLGHLETVTTQLAALQGRERPAVDRVSMVVFAADHGITAQGVSAFPPEVTGQMVANFAAGGAAISVLARDHQASLEVVNLGCFAEPPVQTGVIDAVIAAGTADFSLQPAMTVDQLAQALSVGQAAINRAAERESELFIGGDMGIGNTTAASAIACFLLERNSADLTGPGTGLDASGISKKAHVIQSALSRYADQPRTGLKALQLVGGFEIAAMAGAYIAAAQQGIPVLLDGFISTVAALAAVAINPSIKPWLLLGHLSAEPGHRVVVSELQLIPLLQLEMRLGEGSGAAVALSLLKTACSLHRNMATFAEAAVSDNTSEL